MTKRLGEQRAGGRVPDQIYRRVGWRGESTAGAKSRDEQKLPESGLAQIDQFSANGLDANDCWGKVIGCRRREYSLRMLDAAHLYQQQRKSTPRMALHRNPRHEFFCFRSRRLSRSEGRSRRVLRPRPSTLSHGLAALAGGQPVPATLTLAAQSPRGMGRHVPMLMRPCSLHKGG